MTNPEEKNMETALKYGLDIQLFAEEAESNTEAEPKVEDKAPVIDLNKFDKEEEKDEKLSELEILKKELEAERTARAIAETKAKKNKDAFDKAASDRKLLSDKARALEAQVDEPNEKLTEYQEKLEAYELKEKKNEALLGLTEIVGINRDHANLIVSALYNEDTNEVSVPDLMDTFGQVIRDVITASQKKGYDLREQELASGKPRSMGASKADQSPESIALELYKQRRAKR